MNLKDRTMEIIYWVHILFGLIFCLTVSEKALLKPNYKINWSRNFNEYFKRVKEKFINYN